MKKILLSVFVIAAFIFYAIHQKDQAATATSAVANSSSFFDTSNNSSNGQYKDGTYTGDVADAFYGNLQVKAIISGGKITDVQFLQYPNDRPTSIQINGQAMPILRQEAIQAQSAHVDVVSGATQTSDAFVLTMGSALAKAK